ncbi:MAG TPA: type 1 glutamine amidotransferase domain-containing protein [Polyangiaceae bacterium]|nr:type 1 glutamine amidotransferase domain-containing protein [Polyangiaceae bacterium]
MTRVVIPLPDRDFDVTEVAVPWKLLASAGHQVVFATEAGAKPAGDPRLLTGVVFGMLGAEPEAKAFYGELEGAPEFERPIRWRDIDLEASSAMLLPGGHARGMRQYLEGTDLFAKAAAFARSGKPLAAICHGVLVLARARDGQTGRSVLAGRRTTCLPKYMERSAWLATAWKLGRYYRTYDAYVEDEVCAALDDPGKQFQRGPRVLFRKGTMEDDAAAFVVEDGSYLSARWPGDAYLLARRLLARLIDPQPS